MEAGRAVKWEMTLIPHRAHPSSKVKPPSPLTWTMTTATISCVLTANDIFKVSMELGNFFCWKSYNDFTFQNRHITPGSFAPARITSQLHISFHFYHKLSAHWPFRCVNGPSLCLSLSSLSLDAFSLGPSGILPPLLGTPLGLCSTMNKVHTYNIPKTHTQTPQHTHMTQNIHNIHTQYTHYAHSTHVQRTQHSHTKLYTHTHAHCTCSTLSHLSGFSSNGLSLESHFLTTQYEVDNPQYSMYYSIMAKIMDSGARHPKFKSELCPFLPRSI